MNFQLRLAARYLAGRRMRTILTTLAVTFGVLVIFGMNIILPTMLESMRANTLAASGQSDVTVTHVTGDTFNESAAEDLLAIDGVSTVLPSLNRTVNLPADYLDNDPETADRFNALALVGVDPTAARTMRSYPLEEGRFLNPDDVNSAVVTSTLADLNGLEVGDTLRMPSVNGAQELEIVGLMFPRTEPGNEEVFVNLTKAQAMLNQEGEINAIDLNLNTLDENERTAIIAEIEATLGENFQIGALTSGDEMLGALQMGQVFMSMFGVLALFMGAFIIFNTFRTVVVERRHDIGMLRAIGANRKTIRGIFLAEGLIQGSLGTGLGLVFGYLLGLAVIKLAEGPMNAFININLGDPVVSPLLLVVSILLGVGVTVLAGLIPAMQASRLTPLEALRPTSAEIEFRKMTAPGFIIGAVMIGAALIMLFTGQSVLFGPGAILFLTGMVLVAPALVHPLAVVIGKFLAWVYARQGTGELARGNLTRQPSRAAITASAIMLGFAVLVAASGMVSSMSTALNDIIQDNLGSDYMFLPPSVALWNSNVGSSSELVEQLKGLEGVAEVSSLRFAGSVSQEQAVSVLGIDPQAFPKVSGLEFSEGDESSYEVLNDGRNMIVNGIFNMTLGTQVGDQVELVTPNGRETYTIAAVGNDLLNAKVITAYVSQANLAADFGVEEDVFIQLNLAADADADAVDTAIKTIAFDYPQFSVISGQAYVDTMTAQLETAFIGMYFLLAMLTLPSLIALLNTLGISVLERTREIGMLRAVGATRNQVKTMVVTEALLLAAVGVVFGVLGGIYLGYILVDAMGIIFPVGYAIPTAGILLTVLIGILFGVIAAFFPANQAARLDVVKALRYE